MTHNITTLANLIYDKLANNTANEQFNCDDPEIVDFYLDNTHCEIHVAYSDGTQYVMQIIEEHNTINN